MVAMAGIGKPPSEGTKIGPPPEDLRVNTSITAGLHRQHVHPQHRPTGLQAGSLLRHRVHPHQIILQVGEPGVVAAIAEEEASAAAVVEVAAEEVADDK